MSYEYGSNSDLEGRFQTLGVKERACNTWGLYQMHGNVEEWCKDCYEKYDTPQELIKPLIGQTNSSKHVVRGGSWDCIAGDCRSAYRYAQSSELCDNCIGFRLIVKRS